MVLVDTSVWSLALRRTPAPANDAVEELAHLIRAGNATLIGAIRQELLSGVRTARHYETLRSHLRAFPDIVVHTTDYEDAAGFYNRCRSKGVQGSNTDFLICAVAARHDLAIFTTDGDFTAFARVLPIRLHETSA
jgi:predicted nucleic acid-binding protein